MSINRVTITGNLTRDPELRALPSGSSVLSFGVAVNDRWRNPQTQQWEDRPNYIDCVMFGNRAPQGDEGGYRRQAALEPMARPRVWQKPLEDRGGCRRGRVHELSRPARPAGPTRRLSSAGRLCSASPADGCPSNPELHRFYPRACPCPSTACWRCLRQGHPVLIIPASCRYTKGTQRHGY